MALHSAAAAAALTAEVCVEVGKLHSGVETSKNSGVRRDGLSLERKFGDSKSRFEGRRKFGKYCESASRKAEGGRQRLKESVDRLEGERVVVGIRTYASLVRWCGDAEALREGKRVHDHIVRSGGDRDRYLANLVVEMYGKCGAVADARAAFDRIPRRNVFSWNIMIAAYSHNGHRMQAVELYRQMQREAVKANVVTFTSVLGACSSPAALTEGKIIHSTIVASGVESDVVVENAIVNMYGKCGSVEDARMVFDKIYPRDLISWTCMIDAYSQNGYGKQALELFWQMQQEGMEPNDVTFVGILRACAGPAALTDGKVIHANIVESRVVSDIVVETALVNMYGKCGSPKDARSVFDKMRRRDVVSWTAMIAAYVQNGHDKYALELFRQMQQEGVKPDSTTFVSILSACTDLSILTEGKVIHASLVACGFESNVILGNGLVNMYGKCGSTEDARRVFDKMSLRDVLSWNSMIAVYGQNEHGKEALELFRQMQEEGVEPDSATFVIILSVCASLAALSTGKAIHDCIVAGGFDSDLVVGNALVNMYGKCGSPENAKRAFDKMHCRDVVSWNAIITAYGQNGDGRKALELFEQMQEEDVKPGSATFVSILSACSHAGLVDEGRRSFISMSRNHGIMPMAEHYGCMIDLLGRAGLLHEAEDLINSMPFLPDAVAWKTLLGACRVHGDVERAEHAAKHIFEMEPKNAAPYVILSNIYAASGNWDAVAKLRKTIKDIGVKKQRGCSQIEVNGRVYEFLAGDESHPHQEQIYAELGRLSRCMEEAGYVPDTKAVLHDVMEREKKEMLCAHSEKLAIAFGLIATPAETPLRITKNLRVCSDCHAATKFISKLVERKIIVRDASRFHHFEHGMCSCGDYW